MSNPEETPKTEQTATPPADKASETKPAETEQPVSPLAQADGAEKAAETKPDAEQTEPVSPLAQADGDKQEQPKPENVAEMSDEDYLKAVFPMAGKDEAPLPKAHAEALAAEFRKAGIGTKDATAAMRTVAAFEQSRAKADADNRLRINRAMVKECRDTFGADFDRTVSDAVRGAVALFGDDLARELCAIPEFGANARIIEALARHGRANTDDPGIGAKDAAAEDSRSFAERWTGQREAI